MTARSPRKAASAPKAAATKSPEQIINELRRFTPEQVVALGLTTYTVATLKKLAQRRQIHHHREGAAANGRIYFTLDDLERNNEQESTPPFAATA